MVGGVADLSHFTRRPGLMAGLRTGMVLGVALTVWLFGPGPMAPYRRALLNRRAPELVLVLGSWLGALVPGSDSLWEVWVTDSASSLVSL